MLCSELESRGAYGQFRDAVELAEELDERTVVSGRSGRTRRRGGERLANGRYRRHGRRLPRLRRLWGLGSGLRSVSLRLDQERDGTTRGCGLPAKGQLLEVRPEEDARERRHYAGEQPPSEARGDRRGRRGDGYGEHEGKQERGLSRGRVAPEHSRERDHEADEQHEERGQPRAERGKGAERDEYRSDAGRDRIGERPRTPGSREVGHDEQGDATERDERRDLRVADHDLREGEGWRHDERRARGTAQSRTRRIRRVSSVGAHAQPRTTCPSPCSVHHVLHVVAVAIIAAAHGGAGHDRGLG